MPNKLNDNFLVLHKYYISASLMKKCFDEYLKNRDKKIPVAYDNDLLSFMSYWYGSLYVVIEGWKQLKFKDAKIDALLVSPFVSKLKGTRNDTFHFIKSYHPDRTLSFMKETGSAKWINEVHRSLGRYCLTQIKIKQMQTKLESIKTK